MAAGLARKSMTEAAWIEQIVAYAQAEGLARADVARLEKFLPKFRQSFAYVHVFLQAENNALNKGTFLAPIGFMMGGASPLVTAAAAGVGELAGAGLAMLNPDKSVPSKNSVDVDGEERELDPIVFLFMFRARREGENVKDRIERLIRETNDLLCAIEEMSSFDERYQDNLRIMMLPAVLALGFTWLIPGAGPLELVLGGALLAEITDHFKSEKEAKLDALRFPIPAKIFKLAQSVKKALAALERDYAKTADSNETSRNNKIILFLFGAVLAAEREPNFKKALDIFVSKHPELNGVVLRYLADLSRSSVEKDSRGIPREVPPQLIGHLNTFYEGREGAAALLKTEERSNNARSHFLLGDYFAGRDEQIKRMLETNGFFRQFVETEWAIEKGGKYYFVDRLAPQPGVDAAPAAFARP